MDLQRVRAFGIFRNLIGAMLIEHTVFLPAYAKLSLFIEQQVEKCFTCLIDCWTNIGLGNDFFFFFKLVC